MFLYGSFVMFIGLLAPYIANQGLSRMKPSTQYMLRHVVRHYLMPRWAKTPVDAITADKVNEWVGDKSLSYLSPVTIRGIVRVLQFALGRSTVRGLSGPRVSPVPDPWRAQLLEARAEWRRRHPEV